MGDEVGRARRSGQVTEGQENEGRDQNCDGREERASGGGKK